MTFKRSDAARSEEEQPSRAQPIPPGKDLSAQVARWESEGGRRGTPPRIVRIVVGVDGSEQAAAGMLWAADLAQLVGAEVFAVFAPNPPNVGFSFKASPVPRLELDTEWLNEMMGILADEWCEALKAAGVAHQALIEGGRPAVAIAAVADRVDADLVIVGRRGHGSLTDMMLGSVSQELLHRSSRPILLISEPPGKSAMA